LRFKILIILLLINYLSLYSQKRYEIICKDTIILHNSELICIQEMGKVEKGGNNTGEHIKEYHKIVGLNYSGRYPYCAMGQCYCYGKPTLFKFSALANCIYNNFAKDGTQSTYSPKRHDFIVWKHISKSTGHIGRIKAVQDRGWVLVYEFNTSPSSGNQRDGDGNYIKRRNINHVLGRMKVRGLAGFKIN